MSALVLRGDARRLPLPDGSIDLVVTSPPYWNLRDYKDGDTSLPGQLGSEATPVEFLHNLWECTREWLRVLKPEGSIFVDLGDVYSAYNRNRGTSDSLSSRADAGRGRTVERGLPVGAPRAKSLMLLPEAYRLGCNGMLATLGGPDPMGGVPVIVRSVTIWSKPNGL